MEFSTENNEEIFLKLGVSTVSMENGLENLLHEIPHWNFNKTYNQAKDKWNKELSKIKIKSKQKDEKRFSTLQCTTQ